MTLPANTAHALEQVKLGLAVLYGANYFTEEEWTKIRALIRRGESKSKSAPEQLGHILDEPLISFMDVEDEVASDDVNIQHMGMNTSMLSDKSVSILAGEQMAPYTCLIPVTPTQKPPVKAHVIPVEPSSDEETVHVESSGLEDQTFPEDQVTVPSLSDDSLQDHSRLKSQVETLDRAQIITATIAKPNESSPSPIANDVVSSKDGGAHRKFIPGAMLVAQVGFIPKGIVQLGVSAGDSVKIIKSVSGIMYLAENLTTKHIGQVPRHIFNISDPARKKCFEADKPKTAAGPKKAASGDHPSVSSSSTVVDLDKIEGMNAAEWESDDASEMTASISLSGHGLSDSEGSAQTSLADESPELDKESEMRAMISKVLDEKLQRIQMEGSKPVHSQLLTSHQSEAENTWTEHLKPVPAKKNICWFFATPNRGCRFTAEECRDRHEFSSDTDSFSLLRGKPTWGSIADTSPPSFSNDAAADQKAVVKTCWYWANGGCSLNAKTCKFSHENTLQGVMPAPGNWRAKSKREPQHKSPSPIPAEGSWRTDAAVDWAPRQQEWTGGESSTEKYIPPHIKLRDGKA